METWDAITKRASVRTYAPKPVAKELIEKLVDAGRRAPSARAVEPWEFVVVTEPGVLKKIGEIATTGEFIRDAACLIAVYSRETKYYLEDGSAATENILLAAADAGLGACWVAGDKKPYAEAVSRLLGVPAAMKLVSLVSAGYPAGEVRQDKKRSLPDVIHWEKY